MRRSKEMKKVIIVALMALGVVAAWAELTPMSKVSAQQAAAAWLQENAAGGNELQLAAAKDLTEVKSVTDISGELLYYVVTTVAEFGPAVIVAPYNELQPVMGYIERYNENASTMADFLATAMTKRIAKVKAGDATPGYVAMSKERWSKRPRQPGLLYSGALPVGAKLVKVVKGFEAGGALTHWDQSGSGGYNLYTPENSVCGCLATAGAAVMEFFQAQNSEDVVDGALASRPCTYDGNRLLDYGFMNDDGAGGPYMYNWEEPTAEDYGRAARNFGVAVSMSYTDFDSGAYMKDAGVALTKYFGFQTAVYVEYPKRNQYPQLIYNQVAAGAPVMLGIRNSEKNSGHAVLGVGYAIDSNGDKLVRVFMGWGGDSDGWFALPEISKSYDEIDTLVTMISTDGKAAAVMVRGEEGMTLTTADEEEITIDESGFAAWRVPLDSAAENQSFCYTDTAAAEHVLGYTMDTAALKDIKVDGSKAASGAELCAALPQVVECMQLLNDYTTVYEDAVEASELYGLPILKVSLGEGENAEEMRQYLHVLDEDGTLDDYVLYLVSEDAAAGNGAANAAIVYAPACKSDKNWSETGNGLLKVFNRTGEEFDAAKFDEFLAVGENEWHKLADNVIVEVMAVYGANSQPVMISASTNKYVIGEEITVGNLCITNDNTVFTSSGYTVSDFEGTEIASGDEAQCTMTIDGANTQLRVVFNCTASQYRVVCGANNEYVKQSDPMGYVFGEGGTWYEHEHTDVYGQKVYYDKWVAAGTTLNFVAVPQSDAWGATYFVKWVAYDKMVDASEIGAIWTGPSLTYTVNAPVKLSAHFNGGSTSKITTQDFTLTLAATLPEALQGRVSNPIVAAKELAYGATAEVIYGGAGVYLKEVTATDAEGGVWRARKLVVNGGIEEIPDDATEFIYHFQMTSDATVEVVWELLPPVAKINVTFTHTLPGGETAPTLDVGAWNTPLELDPGSTAMTLTSRTVTSASGAKYVCTSAMIGSTEYDFADGKITIELTENTTVSFNFAKVDVPVDEGGKSALWIKPASEPNDYTVTGYIVNAVKGCTYELRSTTNLLDWSSATVEESIVATGNKVDFTDITVSDTSTTPKRFWRIYVVLPE